METPFTLEREIEGKTYRLESGKLAKLADGAVVISVDDTEVLVTAVASSKPEGAAGLLPADRRRRGADVRGGEDPRLVLPP